MGFGTVFASIAFILIIGLSSYLLVTGTLFTMDTMAHSFRELSVMQNSRMRTGIAIVNISVTDIGNYSRSMIDVRMNNTGATSVFTPDFKFIDVFIYYESVNGTFYRWIPYSTNNSTELGDNEWTVLGITPDKINPRAFDPDEQMGLRIRVYPAMDENSTGWLKVVMPNGVSDTGYFTH